MFTYLDTFQEKGQFEFCPTDILSQVCNAPKDSSGIYLIYKNEICLSNLIYIGISGREGSNNEIIHRLDGIGGRIVNGKQFGESRRKSWPKKMAEEDIEKLHVQWFITYGRYNEQYPRQIEQKLLTLLIGHKGCLPIWNKQI